MNQNSFQKNPFIKSETPTSYKSNSFSNYDKLGRKTVEEVKGEMLDTKYKDFKQRQDKNQTAEPPKQPNSLPDFKSRVNNLRNINRG